MKLVTFVSVGCYLLIATIFFCDTVIPRDVAISVLYVAAVLISLWHPHRLFTVGVAMICTLASILAFLIAPHAVGRFAVALSNEVIALVAIWTTAIVTLERKKLNRQRYEALRQKEEALEQIKTLSGLLPVCAWCKKVRDDQGYWEQIENYVAKHTEASFSHGICPDCSVKMDEQVKAFGSATGPTGMTVKTVRPTIQSGFKTQNIPKQ